MNHPSIAQATKIMDFVLQWTSVLAILIFTLFCNLWISKHWKEKTKNPPQPTGALPVIGHLHLLRSKKPFFHLLGDIADELGPIYTLRLGCRRTLVINSSDAAKECFTINDQALSARPVNAAAKHLGYNCAMVGFAPYGAYWRMVRKAATTELLSNLRLDALERVRSEEINTSIRELYSLCSGSVVSVEMKQWFGDLNYNVVLQMIAGKRYFGSGGGSREAWRFRNAVSEFFRLLATMVPSDMFPFLEWMDVGGVVKAMKKVAGEMDRVLAELLEEHKKRSGSAEVAGVDRDFMDVMLSVIDGDVARHVDKDTVIKATSLAIILGAADTTTKSLTSVLEHLLSDRAILKKVQSELDSRVGKSRLVTENDAKNLVYLQAVIKESFRLTPPSPLLVPREAVKDFTVAGFQIPAGTQVIVNAWKLQRDPRVWSEPTKFNPERFLSSHVGLDVRGHHFELIPFGTGRRVCLGTSFALQVMHLTLARLLQGFELRVAGDVPTGGSYSSAVTEPRPLMVEISPRLPPELYR